MVEAMACGLPILASKTGGLIDSVEDETNGVLLELVDGRAFAMKLFIDVFVGDKELRETFGKESRRIAVEKFDNRLVAQRHVEIAEKGGL